MEVCDKIFCHKLHIGDIEISFGDNDVKHHDINLHLNLDHNNNGLISDGHGNITTQPLPDTTQDIGIIKGSCDMFSNYQELIVSYNKKFKKAPKVFATAQLNDNRYLKTIITDHTVDNCKIISYFINNQLNELTLTNILESKSLNLHYSGYGIIARDDKSLYFINNQSFDGTGPYRYQSIINDQANPSFSSILSVDGYPMVAYSRAADNNLILGQCNSLTGLGKWSFTTNNSIGLYPCLIVTETRRVSIINYDGSSLTSSIVDENKWYSTKIDSYDLNGISACNVDKYYILIATKSNSSKGCRIYMSDPACVDFKLCLTSDDVWLNIDVGVLFDNRPVVLTSSLNGIKMYYNSLVNGSGNWNSIKLSDEIPSELNYLLLGNGQSMVVYYVDKQLSIIYGNLVDGDWQTITLGDVKNISSINTHNGYINIFGSINDRLTSIRSAIKYQFVDNIKDYIVYWYAVDP